MGSCTPSTHIPIAPTAHIHHVHSHTERLNRPCALAHRMVEPYLNSGDMRNPCWRSLFPWPPYVVYFLEKTICQVFVSTVWIPCGAPGSPWMLVTLVNLEWNMWASQAERTGCQGYGAKAVRHSAFIIPISFMYTGLWTHSDSNHITGAKTTRRCPQKNDLMWITALKLALKKSCDRVTFICSFSLAVTLRLHPCGRNQGNRKLKEVLNL